MIVDFSYTDLVSTWKLFIDVQNLLIVPAEAWEAHLENGDFEP